MNLEDITTQILSHEWAKQQRLRPSFVVTSTTGKVVPEPGNMPRRWLRSAQTVADTDTSVDESQLTKPVTVSAAAYSHLDNSVLGRLRKQLERHVEQKLGTAKIRWIRNSKVRGPNGGSVFRIGLSNGYRALVEALEDHNQVYLVVSHGDYDKILNQ